MGKGVDGRLDHVRLVDRERSGGLSISANQLNTGGVGGEERN